VRGVALIGVVVMNYHGYLILAGGSRGDGVIDRFFDPWRGPLATRFAATFVLVAGVGVTLMTRNALGDRGRIASMRWRLARRGVLLYAVGILLDTEWPGTIIPYYGVMFVLAAFLFTLRTRWLTTIGATVAVAGWLLRAWRYDMATGGSDVDWLFAPEPGSLDDYVFGVVLNGTHPLVPWLAFFCAGMILGRFLRVDWWRPATVGIGVMLFAIALALESSAETAFETVLLSPDSLDRGVVHIASALGTALIAYACLDWLAERAPRVTDPLRRTGQMTLTLYLLHVVVFVVLVREAGLIDPAGLGVALTFAVAFWIAAIGVAVWWSKRFGMGPAEKLYRSFGG
jgi:uncharacterized membrane protein YeiB